MKMYLAIGISADLIDRSANEPTRSHRLFGTLRRPFVKVTYPGVIVINVTSG